MKIKFIHQLKRIFKANYSCTVLKLRKFSLALLDKNFVKATVLLLNEITKYFSLHEFDEIFFLESIFFIFHTVICKQQKLKLLRKFLECANKIFKKFRQTRARKSSRVATMKDVYHRMMNVSDPLVLHSPINKNLAYAKNKPFSETVKSMLLPFSIANYVTFDEYMKKK